ncbi:DJ-1/PfpI family protein [Kribbella deserti]|uniref:DJ-1/PfpI family protein n=1 Tax=Kribbella deserti TaxID=1926257 RepID=A0ABV6QXT9_9ACTN
MTMTKQVHVAVFDTFADWEIGYATAHIRKPDWQREPGQYEIVTVGPSTEPVTTMGGFDIVPDLALADLRPEDSAMLILAGGDTWTEDAMAGFRAAARQFLAAGVPVAAVCGATMGLAIEGLLDDRAHTSNAAEALGYTGYAGAAHYREELAVNDRGLITGSGIAPVQFAHAILEQLAVYEPGVAKSWLKLYGDRDPAGFYELMAV